MWSQGVGDGFIKEKYDKNGEKQTDDINHGIWPYANFNESGNLFGHCDEIEFRIDTTENEEKLSKLTIYKDGIRLRKNENNENIIHVPDFLIPQIDGPLYLYCYVNGGIATSDGTLQSYQDNFIYHHYWHKTKNIPHQ